MSMARVVRLGWTPVRGTRWLAPDALVVDADGVRGDRAWSGVDATLDAVRAARHPEMMRLVVDPRDLPDAASAGELTEVTYWGRPIPASLHDGPLAERLTDCVGEPVRLARSHRAGGFVWGAPVSVILTSELDALPHDPPVEIDRYRPNVVIDDSRAPLVLAPGTVLDAGGVRLRVIEPIDRCIVIDHHPLTGERDQHLMARLRPGALLGWGCEVETPGRLGVGDPVVVSR